MTKYSILKSFLSLEHIRIHRLPFKSPCLWTKCVFNFYWHITVSFIFILNARVIIRMFYFSCREATPTLQNRNFSYLRNNNNIHTTTIIMDIRSFSWPIYLWSLCTVIYTQVCYILWSRKRWKFRHWKY